MKKNNSNNQLRRKIVILLMAGTVAAFFVKGLYGSLSLPPAENQSAAEPQPIQDSKRSISKYSEPRQSYSAPSNSYYEPSKTHHEALSPPLLKVLALFDTHDTTLAAAVIYTEDYGAYRYRIGESIADNTTLISIQAEQVDILVGEDILTFSLEPLEGGALGIESTTVQTGSASQYPDEEYLSRGEVSKRTLLARADIRPVKPGHSDGYIVGSNISPDISRHLSIEPGDIIVSVNGYPVGEGSSDHLAWLSVQALGVATAVVRRGTTEITVQHAMNF